MPCCNLWPLIRTISLTHGIFVRPNFSNVLAPDGSPLAREGDALVSASGEQFPIVQGIPRFVSSENYAAAFGDQWNRFPRTQLDSHTGLPITEAQARLGSAGLRLSKLTPQATSEAAGGTIVGQTPARGERVDSSSTIELQVAE